MEYKYVANVGPTVHCKSLLNNGGAVHAVRYTMGLRKASSRRRPQALSRRPLHAAMVATTPSRKGGTSGGGASSDVVIIDSESEGQSGEEAALEESDQEEVQTVRKETVAVASTVGNTKTSKPTRSMLAVLARQRRLEATVAEYRRLVELEGDDTHSSASNLTSSTSSSVTPRSAGKHSAPANRSRAGRRHRRAAKAAPRSTVKGRLRRALRRVSDLEAEVQKWHKFQNVVEGLRLEQAILQEKYDALALKHDALEAKLTSLHP
ncbi:uncharacterized protein LOC144761559 [Lissotriton helveticus]